MRTIIHSLLMTAIVAVLTPVFAQLVPADTIEKQLNRETMRTPSGERIMGLGPPKDKPAGTQGSSAARTVATATPEPQPELQLACGLRPAQGADVTFEVMFATGSPTLTPDGVAQLGELARALSRESLSRRRFCIEGYTDTVGGADYNKTLSERRAASVVSFLVKTGHIDAERLVPVGFGKTNLAKPTPDQTPEAQNRRVRVVNVGASG